MTRIERHCRENRDRCKLVGASDSIDLGITSGRLMFRIRMATSCHMPEDRIEKQRIGIEKGRGEGSTTG